MEIEIRREPSDEFRTFGILSIDGQYECETLEDPVREVPGEPVEKWKIAGRTAIPSGRYEIVLEDSPRFGADTITVNRVPSFSHIRIHAGNTEKDTEGCPLVGQQRFETGVARSRIALAHLKQKVRQGLQDGEVWLTIINS